MSITRRSAIGILAGVGSATKVHRAFGAQIEGIPIAPGPFQGTRESLRAYAVPEWYRDAKFGIWAHWGPQSAPEYGDWYARNMYMEGSRQYKYHVQTYGHPSKFGFKDVIPTWKADRFDPEHLMDLYKKAGARYFCSMGVHHDNFDLWDSKHTRWNAVNMGPKKDIVGLFRQAALKRALKFAVSEHLWISYKWFSVSHGADKSGTYAGVPYDGVDPKNVDLYHDVKQVYEKLPWNADGIPDTWRRHYLLRMHDLIDRYQPDLLYTDGALPFEEYGLNMVAHLYNSNARRHGGKVEAVYTSKNASDCAEGTCVLDFERGVAGGIPKNPWQTDTCVGSWHYDRPTFEAKRYKTPKLVIDMLVDIVSRNGNLMLNFPLPNSGELDSEELKILDEITKWMAVNSEGIYGTRPWKIFGDSAVKEVPGEGAAFNERKRRTLTAEDARFTTKGKTLYAFVMGWPEKDLTLKSLATTGPNGPLKANNVQLLGFKGKLKWTQDAAGLKVEMPAQKPSDHAVALKVALA